MIKSIIKILVFFAIGIFLSWLMPSLAGFEFNPNRWSFNQGEASTMILVLTFIAGFIVSGVEMFKD